MRPYALFPLIILTVLLVACSPPPSEVLELVGKGNACERLDGWFWRCIDEQAGVVCWKIDRGATCMPLSETELDH